MLESNQNATNPFFTKWHQKGLDLQYFSKFYFNIPEEQHPLTVTFLSCISKPLKMWKIFVGLLLALIGVDKILKFSQRSIGTIKSTIGSIFTTIWTKEKVAFVFALKAKILFLRTTKNKSFFVFV